MFQKRIDGSVDFYRDWAEYKSGFGNLNGEFWLGLHKIYRLTNSERYQLRVHLEDIEGKTAYAEYDMFAITSERTKYQLSVGKYSGSLLARLLVTNFIEMFLIISLILMIFLTRSTESYISNMRKLTIF